MHDACFGASWYLGDFENIQAVSCVVALGRGKFGDVIDPSVVSRAMSRAMSWTMMKWRMEWRGGASQANKGQNSCRNDVLHF